MAQVKKELDLKKMFKLSYKYIFAGAIMFTCCMIIRIFASGFVCVVLQILIGVVVYFAILMALKDEYIYSFIGKIREIIIKKISART